MATLQLHVEAVRNAVASTTTCTPATVVSLKSLLLRGDAEASSSSTATSATAATSKASSRAASTSRPPTAASSRPGTAMAKRRPAAAAARDDARHDQPEPTLSDREKAQLATHVINAALKALAEAAKPAAAAAAAPPAPETAKADAPTSSTGDEVPPPRPTARGALRRSMSAPMSPLQPRTLNRVATSPVKPASKSTTTANAVAAGTQSSAQCLAAVECARVAFAALRTLQDSKAVTLPELQLEAGMSSFVAKLLALNMLDQASRELRILKKRLHAPAEPAESVSAAADAPATKTPKTSRAAKTTKTTALAQAAEASASFAADLLDYGDVSTASISVTKLIVASQLQALRILAALKKPSYIDTALPFLRRSCKASPVHLIARCIQAASANPAEQQKYLRQSESLAQLLLALAPSISSKDDAAATELKLSVSPLAALELQALSFETKARCAGLMMPPGGQKALLDADKDVLGPFSRCLATYARRCRSSGKATAYSPSRGFFDSLYQLASAGGQSSLARTSKSPLALIYQTLSAMARENGLLDEAIHWSSEMLGLMNKSADSAAKCCSMLAQLLSLQLKAPCRKYARDSYGLLTEVLEAIKGPLKGDTAELEELLANVCLVRKAAVNVLMSQAAAKTEAVPQAMKHLLEAFVYQCPRFCLRWLGKPPAAKSSSTKDFLRYEQRRALLTQSIRHTLDSAFIVTKTMIEEGRMVWEHLDSVLGDSLTVLEYLGDLKGAEGSASYFVKISHFYYLGYNYLRRKSADNPEALKALRRAIDCIKHRPGPEREKAQLLLKLERLADVAKASGQIGEALGALQSIRGCLVGGGALAQVTAQLAHVAPCVAWSSTAAGDQVESLSRTLIAIHRLEQVHMDWASGMDDLDYAAVLEHRLRFLHDGKDKDKDTNNNKLDLAHPCVEALLGIYSPTHYPVRRLRTLLVVFAANLDAAGAAGSDVLADVMAQTQAALGLMDSQGLAHDAGLAAYVPHYRALAASLRGFSAGYADMHMQVLEQECLAVWRGLLVEHPTLAELEQAVDGVGELQLHLQSVAEFLRAMGRDGAVTRVLELSQGLSRVVVAGGQPTTALMTPLPLAQEPAFALSSHYLRTGDAAAAEQVLGEIRAVMESSAAMHLSATIRFHLTYAEYLIAVGRFDEASEHLAQARPAPATTSATTTWRINGTQKRLLGAQACFLQSLVALEKGDFAAALQNGRSGVRMLFQDWSRLEGGGGEAASPEFWALFHPLFDSMLRLSSIYAHLGLFQETMYYAEQAHKVAGATGAVLSLAQAEAWLASVHVKAGDAAQAGVFVAQARARMGGIDATSRKASLACELAGVYREMGDAVNEEAMLEAAEEVVQVVGGRSITDASSKEAEQVAVSKPAGRRKATTTATAVTRATRATAKTPARTRKAATTTRTTTRTKKTTAVEVVPSPPPTDNAALLGLHASILAQKAMSLLSKKDWATALSILRGRVLDGTPQGQAAVLGGHIALAACLLGHSTEQMARDAVFSVIQDSTLSFPAVEGGVEVLTPVKSAAFIEMLQEAQDCLIAAQAMAAVSGDSVTLNRISSMLQSAVIVLSATAWTQPRALGHPGYASCSVELARNMTWTRERRAVLVEGGGSSQGDVSWWPVVSTLSSTTGSSSTAEASIAHFQRDYVDIIPPPWSVISLALSENRHDLCITKLQAGQTPFVLRLPLERATSRDADSEVFNFQQGRAELLAIVEAINASCHGARDMTGKTAKADWWSERAALDTRLRELLDNVEQIWLGGFRGIFSQHVRRPALFARFARAFESVLDKHLPSRRTPAGRGRAGARGKGKTAAAERPPRVALDPRVLDLFIGLGDATVDGCDFDDALDDLLYFIVDILQFHGERNAYDEIDFDAMVVETFGALYAYHMAVREGQGDAEEEGHPHSILVLDKALHVFPWEALPCMQALAVSRVPSLACLRRLILEGSDPKGPEDPEDPEGCSEDPADGPDSPNGPNTPNTPNTPAAPPSANASRGLRKAPGFYASPANGAYMLNPSGDLPSTQATFDAPLTTSLHGPSWTRIVGRAPTEDEFAAVLRDKDVLLYFGHGSGAQFIRGRTVRKLDRCRAAALLMGCSSAGLVHNGAFELHGTVWDYMLAGCPAVVGTLWDVTDKDIDRFAGRAFEEWGLVPRGSFGGDETSHGKASLVEALVRAREAPRFRYLTAAAVVVYGIPVYLS